MLSDEATASNVHLVSDSDHALHEEPAAPLQRTGTVPMKCDHCHGGRDTPCTCSSDGDDDEDQHPHLHCACLAWMDAVSPTRVGQSRALGLLTLLAVALVLTFAVAQAYQFISTPAITVSDSVLERDGLPMTIAGGCRHAAGAAVPILCLLQIPTAPAPTLLLPVEGADMPLLSVDTVTTAPGRDPRLPVFSVATVFNSAYVSALAAVPAKEAHAAGLVVPAFDISVELVTDDTTLALAEPFAADTFVDTSTLRPDLYGRNARTFLRRYIERDNTALSLAGDLARGDDGGADADIITTSWGAVPSDEKRTANCTDMLVAMDPRVVAAMGLDQCAVMHYYVVGDRVTSVQLPSKSMAETAALVAGLYGGAQAFLALVERIVRPCRSVRTHPSPV